MMTAEYQTPNIAHEAIAMNNDPYATWDGTLTSDDIAAHADKTAILDLMAIGQEYEPTDMREASDYVGGLGFAAFNQAVRDLKWGGRVVIGMDGLMWRRW